MFDVDSFLCNNSILADNSNEVNENCELYAVDEEVRGDINFNKFSQPHIFLKKKREISS